jgi:hypothetical protein
MEGEGMKRRLFILVVVGAALTAGLFFAGCNLLDDDYENEGGDYGLTFINNSSYTVSVKASGIGSFSLGPGQTVTKSGSKSPKINVVWTPVTVGANNSTAGSITFYNK